jgi:hypothetical protein
VPSYLWPIIAENAPIIVEETTNNGDTNQRRSNHLMRIDFDGDNNGANNDANALAFSYPNATPTVYYSVAETADAYYVGYYFYHIRDKGTQAFFNTSGHQHDLEGIYEIIEKSPYYPFGYSRLMFSQAHGAMLPYYSANWFSQPPTVGTSGLHPIGLIDTWPDPNAVARPVVAIRRNDHGTYLAQRCDQPVGYDWDQGYGIYPDRQPSDPFRACIHNDADGIVYLPAPYPCAPSNGCVVDDVPTGAQNGSYYYRITSLFDDATFWPTRQTPELMFGGTYAYLGGNQWGYLGFHGTDGDNQANPPWAWNGGAGDCKTVATVVACWYSFGSDDTDNYYWDRVFWPQVANGYWLTDPASVARTYFPWQNWSTSVVLNPFVGGAGSHPPTLTGWIDGPTSFNDYNNTGTWSAVVSGGTPPYTYEWSGAFSGTESSISGSVTQSDILYLDVWDATGVHLAVSTALMYCPGYEQTDC